VVVFSDSKSILVPVAVRVLRLCCAAVDELLQVDAGIALEPPDQKTRGFMVQITLPW
jgi:hypothetical protein